MNLYLSAFAEKYLVAYTNIFPDEKLNILVSYGSRTQNIAKFIFDRKDHINSIILDSGTYTKNFAKNASTRNKIDFSGYSAYLDTLHEYFDCAFNFDPNFESHGQIENDEYMDLLMKKGLNVVPVVHSYSEEEVECYLAQGHKIIALGFSEGNKTAKNIAKLSRIIDAAGAKTHVLGVSTWKMLANNPIAYCDSSSWVKHGIYGVIRYWNESKDVPDGEDKTDSIYFNDYLGHGKNNMENFLEYKYKDELYAWIKETFGWEYYELLSSDSRDKRVLINIHYFVQLQKRISERHAELGFNT